MLHNIADSLEAHEAAILEANARDVAAAEQKQIDAVLLQRLRLKPEKLRTLARGIRAIADAEEPLQKVLSLLAGLADWVLDPGSSMMPRAPRAHFHLCMQRSVPAYLQGRQAQVAAGTSCSCSS